MKCAETSSSVVEGEEGGSPLLEGKKPKLQPEN